MATTVENVKETEPGATSGDSGDRPDRARAARQRSSTAGRDGGWRNVSPNTIITAATAVFIALVGLLGTLLVSQLNSINTSIGQLDTKIDGVEQRLDAKIDTKIDRLDAKIDGVEDSLRSEMQAGFAQVNRILLDHTERLARLEAHAGLVPTPSDPES